MALRLLFRRVVYMTRVISQGGTPCICNRLHQSAAVFNTSSILRWSRMPLCVSYLHGSPVLNAKKGKKHQSKVDVSRSADDSILDLEQVRDDMQQALDALKQGYMKSLNIRTSQGVLDHIQVSTNDGKFPLNQLGQITSKSANMLVVNMASFPEATQAAAKAIRDSGMNLNPQVTDTVIQVPIPKVTKEHREHLAKQAKTMCDKSKVTLRQIRTGFVSRIKKHKDTASKDTLFALEKQIGQIADASAEDAEKLLAAKTKELLGK
ncbi:ribosome-recycling factor, mitochondrial-like isoform X1 [Acanthaster planci]|uniref:Ribosome-recycling factor, mitochondrial n=1 Tax=Acanthaster planci TaxID=133434 RepID=A0A8B7Z2I1_ACAPL|nr:ribosome-recycling factor, mitochondrial-like isoform X1 [Acanthaster planci]XP_022099180.1 ribosome-recycling factor, mitochondrial-like isoform X1 [Acanthaster planci]XP_022099181.1 ribosome-recycling factor, mitochondrial-like isoform X1 [Acanthaster planci]XP_022099182.1 ribosome-recycling factor, mitochondrial-like isoform X1 [Acanthaster planci]